MAKKHNDLEKIEDYTDLEYLESKEVGLEKFYARYDWPVEEVLEKKFDGVKVAQLVRDYGVSRNSIYNAQNKRDALLGTGSGFGVPNIKHSLPVSNPVRMAESMGAGVESLIQKGLELTNSWMMAIEMLGAKSTTFEFVPIMNENINWKTKKFKFCGEEYDIDNLVPDRRTQLKGFEVLSKITGAQAIGSGMAKEELEYYRKYRDRNATPDGEEGGTMEYTFPGTKKVIEVEVEIEEEEKEEATGGTEQLF